MTSVEIGNAVVLVIDMQERLLPAMHDADACTQAVRKMIEAARAMGVPVVATEQYPAGLGKTCATIHDALGDVTVFEKMRFSGCVDEVVRQLKEMGRLNVIVTGIEAHVCVLQTVLDLLRLGYRPYVCADAVSSRRVLDRDVAMDRMRQAGAVVTTIESVIFELLGQAGTDSFKKILKIVK